MFFVWGKRQAKGALTFFIYLTAQALWVTGFIFEMLSKDIQTKILWDKLEWICTVIVLITIPVFIIQYTEYKLPSYKKIFAASFIIPLVFIALILTDPLHHLIYQNVRLLPPHPFSELTYDITPTVSVFAFYSFLVTLWSFSLLAIKIVRPHGFYRKQVWMIILGLAFPALGSGLAILNIQISTERDPAPLTFFIGSLLTAWGLFRYRTFDVAPVGRDRVFEAIVDPVVILDKHNRVIDINTSMLALLDKSSKEVIGETAADVFTDSPIPIKMYVNVSYARAETSFKIGNKEIFY